MPEQFFHFLVGILYFVLILLLKMVLPAWAGDENGIIENLQLLWLLGGFVYCYKNRKAKFRNWGGDCVSLWNAGMIYFFLLLCAKSAGDGCFLLILTAHLFNIARWVYMASWCIRWSVFCL